MQKFNLLNISLAATSGGAAPGGGFGFGAGVSLCGAPDSHSGPLRPRNPRLQFAILVSQLGEWPPVSALSEHQKKQNVTCVR